MHKLLQRRLQKLLGGQVPAGLEAFLRAVSDDYAEADRDRHLLERSLELSSQELLTANQRLRDDLRTQDAEAWSLKTQWREFRELIRVLPVAVVVRTGDSIVLANDAFLAALGRTEAQLRDAPYSELVHPDDRELARARIAHFERTGDPDPKGETRWLKASGETVHLEDELAREIRLGAAPALLLALRDVTELKNMHARLAVADRMASVGTMAAGVAHEINNPLSFILANVDFVADELLRGVPEASRVGELREALNEATDGANRVREIVRDLKTFSRVGDSEAHACDVQDVVENAIKLAANELRHAAKLERQYAAVSLVKANPGRLGQVFLNLLVNAAQAIPLGSAEQNRVTVVIEPRPDRVCVEVRDTGVGMTAEQVGRIFDPFFTTKPIGEGTGLGLSICHGIITQLGGAIEVETKKGEGSTFRVLLPLAPAAPVIVAPVETPGVRPSSMRVLVVDDDELVGRGVARMLAGAHPVTHVTSALAALELLKADPTRCDVILCDVMMPELGGEAFYLKVKAMNPALATRMVFMTGGAFMPRARQFLETVSNPWIEKPFGLKQVEAALEQVCPPAPGST